MRQDRESTRRNPVPYRYTVVGLSSSYLTRSCSIPRSLQRHFAAPLATRWPAFFWPAILWASFQGVALLWPQTTLSSTPCGPDYSVLHISHPRSHARLEAVREVFPSISDPVRLVLDFSERRRLWNLERPLNHPKRNNFPAPELKEGVREALHQLRKIKRPAENRASAEKLIRALQQSEVDGLPYRDTYRKIEEATFLIQLRFRNPTVKAAAISLSSRFSNFLPPGLRQEVLDLQKKHKVFEVIPEYHVKSQEQLDAFDAGSGAYFKELKARLDLFFETAEGRSVRAELLRRQSALKKIPDNARTSPFSEDARERTEIESFLKIFADENRTGIQDFVTRPTFAENIKHPSNVVPVDESLFETEILIPTTQNLSIDALAESFLVGITPVQIISRPRMADDLWMDSYLFANHDGFHRYLAAYESDVNRQILSLPLPERLAILSEIDRLESPERRSLARAALYLTIHENGSASNLPVNSPIAAASTRDEFKRLAGRTLSNTEISWIRDWYRKTIQSRVDQFRPSRAP